LAIPYLKLQYVGAGGLNLLQAEVDLLAEILRQPRDFASSRHILFFLP
jgi:hypothetical protein